jgi:aspartyl-tRNA(Asn)/glutamyl-tRNA(Gln) amidotransferase subunit C
MTKEEIKKLGTLSRIALTEAEVESFSKEIDAILDYVSVVKDIAADSTVPTVGVRYNVLRPDEVVHQSGTYTESILKAMPKTNGQYLSVKKILQQSE